MPCFPLRRAMLPAFLALYLISCGEKRPKEKPTTLSVSAVPEFNADTAVSFVRKQVTFGPRIPGTSAHRKAGEYLIQKLRAYGARVSVQEFEATLFDGRKINLLNIMGQFRPEVQKRVLLAAHWDTRPFSDKDPARPNDPFDGANDGASGVGLLLEIARNLKTPPNVGIDILFFDGEDWGEPDGQKVTLPEGLDSWWCLGSQHWSKNKIPAGYRAYFGVLVDMVGGRDAKFYQEGASLFYAPKIVEKVWSAAARLGHQSTFISQKEEPITDDHVYVNQWAEIPMINIVAFDPASGYFGSFHHTQQDNMELISANTMGIVGEVLMHLIYRED